MPARIVRPQRRRDRLLHHVMDVQAVAAALHERQRAKPVEGVLRRNLRERSVQKRKCGAADDRGRLQRLPRERVVDVGEVDTCQLLDDALDRHIF